MSLFGSSPDEPAPIASNSRSKNSLFDDEPSPAPGSKSSLFADDDAPGASPWGMPTPKKAARGELIKNLLPASDVPDSYIDLFETIVKGDDQVGGKINAAGVGRVLSAGNLGADDQSHIMSIISPSGKLSDIGRNEFNVLLALIGLAQEHEDITLDSVDERRRSKYSFAFLECMIPMLIPLQIYQNPNFPVYPIVFLCQYRVLLNSLLNHLNE